MTRKPVSQRALLVLITAAIVLPITVLFLWALSALTRAMGDEMGAAVLLRVAQAGGILWGLDLIFLLLAQGLNSLVADDTTDDPGTSD